MKRVLFLLFLTGILTVFPVTASAQNVAAEGTVSFEDPAWIMPPQGIVVIGRRQDLSLPYVSERHQNPTQRIEGTPGGAQQIITIVPLWNDGQGRRVEFTSQETISGIGAHDRSWARDGRRPRVVCELPLLTRCFGWGE